MGVEDRFGDHNERKSGYYSWLYHNDHLRRCILASMKAGKLSYRVLAKATRTPLSNLNIYVNKPFQKDRKGLSDFQILKVADFLKIEFSLKIDYKNDK